MSYQSFSLSFASRKSIIRKQQANNGQIQGKKIGKFE